MKTLNVIQKIMKVGKILSKIAFIFSVIGFGVCLLGVIAIACGSDSVIKIGGVTLHGIISDSGNYSPETIAAMLSSWLVFCAGEAVIAKFAEIYFANELKAQTPFTDSGARELMRLGIIAIAVSLGCSVIGSIVYEFVAIGSETANDLSNNFLLSSDSDIAFGIMFIIMSLFCRYGAEVRENSSDKVTENEKTDENTL